MSCLRLLLVFILIASHLTFADSNAATCTTEIPLSILREEPTPEIVTNTTLDKFTATLDGHPTRLSGLRANASPHRFVLVLDQSGSIADKLWPGELTLAKHFAASLNPTAQAGFIGFNRVVQSKVPLTSGREIASKLDAIEKTQPKGTTSIFSALNGALDLLEPSHPGDIIYLLSDGGENSPSSPHWNGLRDRLQRDSVRLFAMILVDDQIGALHPSITLEERQGWLDVRSLILDSGGTYSLLSYSRSGSWNQKLMSNAAYAFYRVMMYDYLLQMEVPKSAKETMKLNLKFENPQNGKERYRVLSTSRVFNPCLAN